MVRKSFKTNELLCNLVTTSDGLDQFDLQKFAAFLKGIFGERLAGLLHTINDETGDRTIATAGRINLVYGKDKIVEELLGLNFEISMKSFFQTNPKCAEKLYQQSSRIRFGRQNKSRQHRRHGLVLWDGYHWANCGFKK